MQKCSIYKLKENKSLNKTEEYLSQYVYLIDFARNPQEKEGLYCVYRYIFIDDLEPTSKIICPDVVSSEVFEEHFELFMDIHAVNKKIRELDKG